MTSRVSFAFAIAAMIATLGAPTAMRAQDAPIPKAPAPPAPPPPIVAVPISALIPSDSAVALCMDGTWVNAPRTAADCTTRGGLRVAMPPKAAPPASVSVPAVSRNIIVAPSAILGIPANATMQCKDGTFLFGAPSEGRCAQNGGVAAFFPAALPPPPPPRRP